MRKRVVVTGVGAVTPLGCSAPELVDGLMAGRSGVGPITLFDPAELPTRIAAEVKLALPELVARSASAGGSSAAASLSLRDRKIAFALEAARQALDDASRGGTRPGGEQGGLGASVSVGVGLELFSMDDLARLRAPGFLPDPHASPDERLAFLQTPSDLCARLISRRHGLLAPPLVLVSACAAGTDAIGAAYRLVAEGRRRWMLAGGTDSMINPLGVAGFCRLSATSTRNAEPARASRPFDRRRDGFVLGEGAAMLVLEALEDAHARGAVVLAEIAGYGCSFDAHGISEPHPEARGALQAMERALRDAGVVPGDIDAINAHGTSTPKNDPTETLAIKRLLGDRARSVPVVATKSMIGHLISAAGAVEAVASIGCMNAGVLHPTINLDEPDPLCDLDHVPHVARAHEQGLVLTCSYAFGGQNAALVLRNARLVPGGQA
jgi:3-oxoacyl-[acyl-carrier-protein] synthase II